MGDTARGLAKEYCVSHPTTLKAVQDNWPTARKGKSSEAS
jgi:hypothetical protein